MNLASLLRRPDFPALFGATYAHETPPLLLILREGFRWEYCALHPAGAAFFDLIFRQDYTGCHSSTAVGGAGLPYAV